MKGSCFQKTLQGEMGERHRGGCLHRKRGGPEEWVSTQEKGRARGVGIYKGKGAARAPDKTLEP